MASEKPGSVQQEETTNFDEVEVNLLSMENLDRSSPELWPEKYPGMKEFINNYTPASNKLPYSKEFNQEDNNYMHQLASLSTAGMISRVKEMHDIAYQMGVEEAREIMKGKYLNIFSNKKRKK